MEIKKIIIICTFIVMVCLVLGAVYLESQMDVISETRYEFETEDFNYDDGVLIVRNQIIEDAEDVNYDDGILKYTVVDKDNSSGIYFDKLIFPLITVPLLSFFILLFIDD